MATILLTGFPGFLGSALLPRVLGREPREVTATCLVQERFRPLAEQRAAAIAAEHGELAGRIRLVAGDITRGGLGLEGALDPADVIDAYHLAAVYDLAVRRDVAMRVNVDGTRNVLDWIGSCPSLRRLHYVSTCYVSGRYAGAFRETDLEKRRGPRPFNNFYEETKFLAEVEVQARMRAGLPATVYRPSIVVGDSVSGATQKFDGPYFILQWILRQPRVAIVPVVGDPEATRVNVAPRDFIIDAIASLSGRAEALGKVYQLADPEPLTVSDMLTALGEAAGRRLVRVPLPAELAKAAIDRVPGVDRLLRIPAPAVDYFTHPTHYLCDQATADLAPAGISCPRFDAYAGRLVEFMRAHPEVGSAAMV